mgnify:CR=1 FL=1
MGIEAFAVATIDEGIKLREHGIYGEILVLGYSHPIRAIELHNYRLIQTIVNREHARQLNESGHMINVHIKIDTGMHRLGFDLSDYESIKEIYDYQLFIFRVILHIFVFVIVKGKLIKNTPKNK